MTGSELQLLTGARNTKKNLELLKKKKSFFKDVVKSENSHENTQLYNTTCPSELVNAFVKCKEVRDKSRQLYFSRTRMKRKFNYELQKRRARNRRSSKERQFAMDINKALIMFIGDRGHGTGSRIKGHIKYGGHGHVPVAITNEHNSSQTCVYCFKKKWNIR
jgi:hypothetical protein